MRVQASQREGQHNKMHETQTVIATLPSFYNRLVEATLINFVINYEIV